MRRVAGIVALLAGFSGQSFAASLSDYIGVWRGKGTYTRSGGSEQEGRLTCKLTIVAEGNNSIVVNGRCAAPEGSRGFKTQITDNGGGSLSGLELSRLGIKKQRHSTGTLTDSGIDLAGRDKDGSFEFRLLKLDSGQMRMKSGSDEGEKSESADVVLRQVSQ